ncbi:MAG TPA: hypothetical protein VE476_05990 [Propionibacteriaceae bacterium]|nr:hypothetical protein [Propionibacteriaceae bacterium]
MTCDLNVDSLARGDSHMVARFIDAWNAARTERAAWPVPWSDEWNAAEAANAIDTTASTVVVGYLNRLTYAWTRHLLREVGVKDSDLPPPTSSQQRKLIRLLTEHGSSGDEGLELLTSWAHWKLTGQVDKLHTDFERLAGDLRTDVLAKVVNHVRRTSPEFNGQDFEIRAEPRQAAGE